MALVPKIDVCINNKCDKLDIYEKTGPYDATNNTEGWANSGSVSGHIDTSEIVTADLKIYDYLQNTLYSTIVLKDGVTDVYAGVVGAPAPSGFFAVNDSEWAEVDGIYKLVYTINSSSASYTNETQFKLFICNLENCLANLKAKSVTECDAKTLANIKDKIDQLEVIIYGIKSAFSCADWDTANTLISNGTIICDNLCDCGCGDC